MTGEELAAWKADIARLLEGKSKKALAIRQNHTDRVLRAYYEGLSDGLEKARQLVVGIGPFWRNKNV